jgi:acyl-CoA thioester hydrolase
MGIVYHSNYFPWFEEARTGFFEAIGLSYAELEAQGLYFPLIECGCRFKTPAKYADWVTVRATLREMKGARVTLGYEVTRKSDGRLLVEGFTCHTFVDKDFRPVNMLRTRPDVYNAMLACLSEQEDKSGME